MSSVTIGSIMARLHRHGSFLTAEDGAERADRLTLRAGGLLVGLAAAHTAYFLPNTVETLGDWLTGSLWTLDLDAAMTHVDAAFWALPGGFALPLGLLGLLVRRQAREGTPPPAWLGWGVGVWSLTGSLISQPSGFPLGFVPAAMLLIAARRTQRHRVASQIRATA